MVFLTFANMARKVVRLDKFWRKEMYKRMSWHFYGRKRNCFSIAVRYVRRALRYSTQSRELKKKSLTELRLQRIEAACQEHGMSARTLQNGLVQSNVALNKKILADLAIYEPRTFSSLVDFVHKRNSALGLSPEGYPRPSGYLNREMR
ncbi:large ribosomal subunit protein bL20m-like [Liolophura sinensis]|uniref:large ribosomal subunit protein bL20m-like n=1 Tax=Liolophura sinensis TaxID=3198878 RepID=UPI0031587469